MVTDVWKHVSRLVIGAALLTATVSILAALYLAYHSITPFIPAWLPLVILGTVALAIISYVIGWDIEQDREWKR